MMKKYRLLCCAGLFASVLLFGCGEVQTCTLQQLLEATASPSTMFRGVDYLGSDATYHYFDFKKELEHDIRFRVKRADYTPAEEWKYCCLFPGRKALDYQEMILDISMEEDGFLYRIGNREFCAPAEIPASARQKIRLVKLPSKVFRVSLKAEQNVLPFLKNPRGVYRLSPISGIHRNPLMPK